MMQPSFGAMGAFLRWWSSVSQVARIHNQLVRDGVHVKMLRPSDAHNYVAIIGSDSTADAVKQAIERIDGMTVEAVAFRAPISTETRLVSIQLKAA